MYRISIIHVYRAHMVCLWRKLIRACRTHNRHSLENQRNTCTIQRSSATADKRARGGHGRKIMRVSRQKSHMRTRSNSPEDRQQLLLLLFGAARAVAGRCCAASFSRRTSQLRARYVGARPCVCIARRTVRSASCISCACLRVT